jgi:hypothetical protein
MSCRNEDAQGSRASHGKPTAAQRHRWGDPPPPALDLFFSLSQQLVPIAPWILRAATQSGSHSRSSTSSLGLVGTRRGKLALMPTSSRQMPRPLPSTRPRVFWYEVVRAASLPCIPSRWPAKSLEAALSCFGLLSKCLSVGMVFNSSRLSACAAVAVGRRFTVHRCVRRWCAGSQVASQRQAALTT